MKNLKKAKVNFDNGGGIQVWTVDYAHDYNDGKQAAQDVRLILAGADPAREWDGNDVELLTAARAGEIDAHPENETYTLAQISSLLKSWQIVCDEDGIEILDGRHNPRVSGYAETQFFFELLRKS